jgi:hypothetical protein
MTRVWENAVTGTGAYLPGAVLFLVGVPMLAYFALWGADRVARAAPRESQAHEPNEGNVGAATRARQRAARARHSDRPCRVLSNRTPHPLAA